MFKKIFLSTVLISLLSHNTLHACQNQPQKELPMLLKAAIKGGKAGCKSGFLCALPAIYFLHSGHFSDKILLPILSGLSAGTISFTAGGIYACLKNGLKNNTTEKKQAIKLLYTAKGMGISFGITAGLCAFAMAQMSDMRIGRY